MGGIDSLRDMSDNWKKWREFAKGKTVVEIPINEYIVHDNAVQFKSHRDFIRYCFKSKGYEVTRFGHKYRPDGSVDEWGLVFDRGDSDITTTIFVKGIIGVNISPIVGALL
jgi:hypothetical protein